MGQKAEPTQPAEKSVMLEGRFLRMVNEGGWEYVERTGVTGVVVIVPITDQDELVLVEQYRKPVNSRVLELPAGLAGDIAGEEDEAFTTAATRELFEETGYSGGKMIYLSEGPTSAGMSTELVCFYGVNGVTKTGDGGGDGSEDIECHIIPMKKVASWIQKRKQQGVLIDPKIYSGLYFARQRKSWL